MVLSSNEYLDEIVARLNPIGEIHVRRAVGGYGLYRRGVMFGMVAFDELYFKTGKKNLAEYLAAGSSPLMFPGKHQDWTLSFRRVPSHVIQEKKLLEKWVINACIASTEQQKEPQKPAPFKRLFMKLLGKETHA